MAPLLIPVVTVRHVRVGVFRAGSVFVHARISVLTAELLAYPKIGVGGVSVLSGADWGNLTHGPDLGPSEPIFGPSALCAVTALGVPMVGSPAIRRLIAVPEPVTGELRGKIKIAQRLAAAFLIVAIISMVLARYA
jgi:hypothetical protein